MPHPTDTGPPANANRGAAIRAHLQARLDAEMPGHRHQPQAFNYSLNYARQLCFPGAQSNGLLGRGP
eukprot:7645863-Alexandrium_andersonii.AAC.1